MLTESALDTSSGDGRQLGKCLPKRVIRIGFRVFPHSLKNGAALRLKFGEWNFLFATRIFRQSSDMATEHSNGAARLHPDHPAQLLHRRRALIQPCLLFRRQLDLDDLLDSL